MVGGEKISGRDFLKKLKFWEHWMLYTSLIAADIKPGSVFVVVVCVGKNRRVARERSNPFFLQPCEIEKTPYLITNPSNT